MLRIAYILIYIENFRQKLRILKLSHSAENIKWDPLGFLNIQFVAKHQKNEGGTLRSHLKIFEKILSAGKKIERGEAFSLVRFRMLR